MILNKILITQTKILIISRKQLRTTMIIQLNMFAQCTAKAVETMRKEYDRRRKMIIKRVREVPGWSCLEPEGAFYLFANIRSMGMTSLSACEWLLREAKVATIPGTEFGGYGEGFIRLSYATEFGLIEKAMDRIKKAVRKRGRK